MTVQTIESKDFSLGDVFTSFYLVPDYQREFVWEDKQVDQLLQDIHTEYSSNGPGAASEYFIGSIVVCARDDGVLELIDGQQRMTTAFLLLCAIRDHLAAVAPGAPIGHLGLQIAAMDVDDQGQDVFRHRVMLQYEDSCDVLTLIGQGDKDLRAIQQSTRSVTNILNAYWLIRAFLSSQFGEDTDALRRFYAYLVKSVKLIRVKTISVAHALKIFETINDRGVGLDSMDLLKNLMFMHATREQFDRLKRKWKELVDALFNAREKPLRFLRYFIFSEFHVERLREDEIYEWFVTNEPRCGYKQHPLRFVERLLEAARAYVHFLGGRDASGHPNRYLANIRYLSGSARQHVILLLAGRRLPGECFDQLCRHVENLFFAYVITREPTREFERRFAQWAKPLKEVSDEESLQQFLQAHLVPAKTNLATRFGLAFAELCSWSLQKYRLRYVLAKLTQYVNEQAWGSTGAQVDLGNFIHRKAEIEHILPQTPSAEVLSAFDRPDEIEEYVYRLGNLTLVEKTINCSVGNGLFAAKRVEYFKSSFLLTKSLGGDISVGGNTAPSRVAGELLTFDEWSTSAIEARQQMLARLAYKTWDMPAPEGASTAGAEA